MNTQEIIDALKRLDIPEYHHLSDEEKEDAYRQMCQDLSDLADRDGCIAAAFSLSVFSAIAKSEDKDTSLLKDSTVDRIPNLAVQELNLDGWDD